MTKQLLSRGGQAVVVAFTCVTIVFLIVRLFPGNIAVAILGPHATPGNLAALTAQLHLNEPLWRAYISYLSALSHGELGTSLTSQEPVTSIIGSAFPITLSIVLCCVVVSVLVGVPVGLAAAVSRRPGLDGVVRTLLACLQATPAFVIGLILIIVVAFSLKWLPAGGWGGGAFSDGRFVVLPSLALSAYLTPLIARTVRQAARDIWRERFIEAAIARGINGWKLMASYMVPNVALPVLALVGVNVGAMITGAVVVEAVFGVPGLGTQLVTAVGNRDYPIIQGIAVVTALFVVVVNLVADAVGMMLDPRAKRVGRGNT